MPHTTLPPAQPVRRTFALFYTGLAMVAAMAVLVAWIQLDARAAARHQAEQAAANITVSLAHEIDQLVRSLDVSLQSIAHDMAVPELAAMPAEVQHRVLFNHVLASDAVDGVFVTDDAGCIIKDSLIEKARHNCVTDRAYFMLQRDHQNLGLLLSEPLNNRSNGALAITLSRRIIHPDGISGYCTPNILMHNGDS